MTPDPEHHFLSASSKPFKDTNKKLFKRIAHAHAIAHDTTRTF